MIAIRIQPDADLVRSLVADTDDQETMALWHGREVPAVAARRLDVYVERVEQLVRQRWPSDELDVTITSEQIRTGGATPGSVYLVDDDHGGVDLRDELREISERAWMDACAVDVEDAA